jgi:hypothetical protein
LSWQDASGYCESGDNQIIYTAGTIPVAYRPAVAKRFIAGVYDDSSLVASIFTVDVDGSVYFRHDVGNQSSFTIGQ